MLRQAIGIAASLSLVVLTSASFSACFLPGIDPSGAVGTGGGGAANAGGGGAANNGGENLGGGSSCEPPQTPGDCLVRVCDGEGVISEVPDDGDLPTGPPPPCRAWSCDAGVIGTVSGADCDNCCGVGDALSCENGTCVGCSSGSDCGSGDVCFAYECPNGTCEPVNLPGPCGAPACVQLGLASAQETSGTCIGTLCQPVSTDCGSYTCDGDTCFEACTTITGEDIACQPGNDCKGFECGDCATCAEVVMQGISNVCPASSFYVDAVIGCHCVDGIPDECTRPCPAACPGGIASDACFGCLLNATGCTAEKVACQADTDPVP